MPVVWIKPFGALRPTHTRHRDGSAYRRPARTPQVTVARGRPGEGIETLVRRWLPRVAASVQLVAHSPVGPHRSQSVVGERRVVSFGLKLSQAAGRRPGGHPSDGGRGHRRTTAGKVDASRITLCRCVRPRCASFVAADLDDHHRVGVSSDEAYEVGAAGGEGLEGGGVGTSVVNAGDAIETSKFDGQNGVGGDRGCKRPGKPPVGRGWWTRRSSLHATTPHGCMDTFVRRRRE